MNDIVSRPEDDESTERSTISQTPLAGAFDALHGKIDSLRIALDELKSTDGTGGGGNMSIIEYRLNQIEAKAEKTDAKLDKITDTLSALNATLSGVSGRLDLLEKKIPSWWQAPLGLAGLISLIGVLFGIAKSLHWLG